MDKIDALHRDLTCAWPHPFDWMGLLERPAFWKWSWRREHRKAVEIFAAHGFDLTPEVAQEYHRRDPDEWMHYGEDAGSKMHRRLSRALADQLENTDD